jgi:hypothetical protein
LCVINGYEFKQMKINTIKAFCFLIFLVSFQVVNGQQIDVINYEIHLEITEFKSKNISGFCELEMKTKAALKSYTLSLRGLTVDSVTYQNQSLSFTHTKEDLTITWPVAWTENEIKSFRVYYHGQPERDASWGGFYFSGDYAYNLGVGFSSDPHNFGRIWYPCNDVFPDRATYEFYIETESDKKAMCNGTLVDESVLPNGNLMFHWLLRDPIPTYLASVAVAPYEVKSSNFSGIPVTLAAVATDTSNMYTSFENLPNCIETYIKLYGEHSFERIGFNLVPFNGGAMEHATNIAYPRFGATGNKSYETLWAHELAHHWFGNTITCESQEHMWINEGWASYSERIFLEGMYGKDKYKEDVSANHRAVLHYAHLRDGAVLPVAGIGHANTYGSHVYNKGAEVAHTLRGYLGDSIFFLAVRELMKDFKFKSINTDQMQSHFQKFTTQDMAAFFKHWVNQPGFPHFDVLEVKSDKVNSIYQNQVSIRQRNRMAPERFDGVALEITFYDAQWNSETHQVILNDDFRQDVMVDTKINPVWLVLDEEEKISDAITEKQLVIDKAGSFDFGDALFELEVKSLSDSALVRVEHNWVSPDHYFNPEQYPVLSSERYWTVGGLWPSDLVADATIDYNGSTPGSSYPNGYLDNNLIKITEDSLVLMYRENAGMNWVEYEDYEKITRTKLDKKGQIIIKNIKRGEYAFAMYNKDLLNTPIAISVPVKKKSSQIKIFPNPSDSVVKFEWSKKVEGYLEITDNTGRVVHKELVSKKECSYKMDVTKLKRGVYYVGLVHNNQSYQLHPFYVK